MPLSLYDVSIASYQQVLDATAAILEKGAEHADGGGIDLAEIVETRLREDMAPFRFQVVSVWHHSHGAVAGIRAGNFAPPPDLGELDYAALQALVAEARETVRGVAREEMDELEGRPLLFKAGGFELPFSVENFILSFSLPNFYFHATTTYAILRMAGVPLGKLDFLGNMRLDA